MTIRIMLFGKVVVDNYQNRKKNTHTQHTRARARTHTHTLCVCGQNINQFCANLRNVADKNTLFGQNINTSSRTNTNSFCVCDINAFCGQNKYIVLTKYKYILLANKYCVDKT